MLSHSIPSFDAHPLIETLSWHYAKRLKDAVSVHTKGILRFDGVPLDILWTVALSCTPKGWLTPYDTYEYIVGCFFHLSPIRMSSMHSSLTCSESTSNYSPGSSAQTCHLLPWPSRERQWEISTISTNNYVNWQTYGLSFDFIGNYDNYLLTKWTINSLVILHVSFVALW